MVGIGQSTGQPSAAYVASPRLSRSQRIPTEFSLDDLHEQRLPALRWRDACSPRLALVEGPAMGLTSDPYAFLV